MLSIPAVTIAAECYGVSIGIHCCPEDAAAVSTHLPLGCNPISPMEAAHRFIFEADPHIEGFYSVKRGLSAKAQAPAQPLEAALRTLQKELHICVAEHATSHAFVHAGVVAWKDRTIILPGCSHAGKSTLVWSLVQAGAVYYSDEYAIFDEHGSVYPFALPIGLRLNHGERRFINPDNVASSPRKPDFIVFARHRSGAKWRPRRLQPAAAVLQLLRHSIAVRRNPVLVLPVLKQVSLQSKAFTGTRGDSKQLLDWLAVLLN
jgi:hypothetical protein